MTREDIRTLLDFKGIPYNKLWKTEKLAALLAEEPQPETTPEPEAPKYSDEEIARIARDVSGAGKPPIEKVLEMTTREGGEAATKSGIVVPGQVLASYKPTKWTYGLDRGSDSVRVFRTTPTGYTESVRTYSRAVHGVGYLELAKGFAEKNS